MGAAGNTVPSAVNSSSASSPRSSAARGTANPTTSWAANSASSAAPVSSTDAAPPPTPPDQPPPSCCAPSKNPKARARIPPNSAKSPSGKRQRYFKTAAVPYTGFPSPTSRSFPNHSGSHHPASPCVFPNQATARRIDGLASQPTSPRHACQAAKAWAVKSGALRSNGKAPHPLQNVGIPPSRFCKPPSQRAPASAASRSAPPDNSRKASKAPAVSSASGTPPGKSVHAHPPGADKQ